MKIEPTGEEVLECKIAWKENITFLFEKTSLLDWLESSIKQNIFMK